jgi:hypothetical protein
MAKWMANCGRDRTDLCKFLLRLVRFKSSSLRQNQQKLVAERIQLQRLHLIINNIGLR